MGVFRSAKHFPISVPDLAAVATDVTQHFAAQGYEVAKDHTIAGAWDISISKGGLFKSVLGMKTALKIELERSGSGTQARAGVGIFGMQAIPSVITWFFAWPVLITQIWGLVEQANLDDEALACIERSLTAHANDAPTAASAGSAADSTPGARFCTSCGAHLERSSKFCPSCGAKQEA